MSADFNDGIFAFAMGQISEPSDEQLILIHAMEEAEDAFEQGLNQAGRTERQEGETQRIFWRHCSTHGAACNAPGRLRGTDVHSPHTVARHADRLKVENGGSIALVRLEHELRERHQNLTRDELHAAVCLGVANGKIMRTFSGAAIARAR